MYPNLYMNGRAIFNFCVSKIPNEIDKVCEINNIEKNGIDFFVLNQASKFILDKPQADSAEIKKRLADCLASADYEEGRRAFMDKRKPNFKGS